LKNIRRAYQGFQVLSRRPTRAERPRWRLAFTFTFSGAALLSAGYFASTYGQAVLVGLGSTLVLFSLVTYASPRLVERIGAAMNLTSLADIQAALKAEFNRAAWESRDPSDSQSKLGGADLIDEYVRGIGRTIADAGFLPEYSDTQLMIFRDTGSLNIVWTISWDNDRLKQTVTSGYFNDEWSCRLDDYQNEIRLRKSLIDLQDRAEFAMRGIALALARRRARAMTHQAR
jgi:hypothetical protein